MSSLSEQLVPRKARDVSFSIHERTMVPVAVEDEDVPDGAKAIKNIFIVHDKKSVCISFTVGGKFTVDDKDERKRGGRMGRKKRRIIASF